MDRRKEKTKAIGKFYDSNDSTVIIDGYHETVIAAQEGASSLPEVPLESTKHTTEQRPFISG